MSRTSGQTVYAAGILERYDHHVLIALPKHDDIEPRRWLFPRGTILDKEIPETAVRRIMGQLLGVEIEIVIGQPPILERVDGERVEIRYFFCGLVSGEPSPGDFEEIRWVHRIHLSEYDFDEASLAVTQWLLDSTTET